MVVTDRVGAEVSLTENRYGRFARTLNEFEGWLGRLRADYGNAAADFVVTHRLVETDAVSVTDVEAALGAMEPNGYEISITDQSEGYVHTKVIERETSAATFVDVPAAVFESPVYAGLRRTYARLVDIVGPPPYEIALGKKGRSAETFELLRHEVLDLAKEGIQVSRFKGLGEMNADELRDTTMDPARRMLVQVEVEDSTAADEIFSKLMGDQVEPRREFIEQNAKDVRFLDV
jgi:DNA gyrase subunit B